MNWKSIYPSILILWVCVITGCKKDAASVSETPEKPVEIKVTELDRPINVKATKGTWGTKVVISWTPMPLAKNYQVYKFDEVAQQYQLFKELADTTVDDLISKPLIKSFYKVKVYNSATAYSLFSDADYGYTSGQTYNKLLSFGAEGTGNGQFQFPTNVEVDDNDNIYVSDESVSQIQRFDKTGKFSDIYLRLGGQGTRGMCFMGNGNVIVTHITEFGNNVSILNAQKQVLTSFAPLGAGDGDGKFGNTRQISIDNEKNIYIVDQRNNRVQKFDQNGNFLLKFGNTGASALNTPWGVCYANNSIYVTSSVENKVNVYDKAGNYIKSINVGAPGYCIKSDGESLFIGSAAYVIKTDFNGQVIEKIGQGQFSPIVAGVALTKAGDLVVSDVYARKIFVFKKL